MYTIAIVFKQKSNEYPYHTETNLRYMMYYHKQIKSANHTKIIIAFGTYVLALEGPDHGLGHQTQATLFICNSNLTMTYM